MASRIEIECRRCKKRHTVKTLASSLLCCSTPTTGPRYLISAFSDPEAGAAWFTVTRGAIVRIYTRESKPKPSVRGDGKFCATCGWLNKGDHSPGCKAPKPREPKKTKPREPKKTKRTRREG